ncbi:MAG: VWA domain-containing protein [Planctomycetaceae bacterium]
MRKLPQHSVATGVVDRRGVSAVLVVAMIFVFIVAAALTVDVAYMQLIRTELRVATDSAAQAAAEALARTEDQAVALTTAKAYAARNTVAGSPLVLDDADVLFGRVALGAGGKWVFTQGLTPPNSVRVLGRIADDAATQAIPLFFAPALGHDDFSTEHAATASEQNVEVCLCLDRSGSMLFDMSGVEYIYTMPNPNLSELDEWGETWQYHLSPPHPTGSRWSVLAGAIDVFLQEAGSYVRPPRVGLVTWSSDYVVPSPIDEQFFTTFNAVDVDVPLPAKAGFTWSANSGGITGSVAVRGSLPMMGATNMAAGLNAAVAQLTGANATSLSSKVIILLSDGQWNEGEDPEMGATAAAVAAGITVHTVSMLSTDQQTLIDIATATGGKFYLADDATALRAAFFELARTLPIVLTD